MNNQKLSFVLSIVIGFITYHFYVGGNKLQERDASKALSHILIGTIGLIIGLMVMVLFW